MPHLVFLGDSIFDNASYVPGGPSVLDHSRRELGKDWQATLLAVDGSIAQDVPSQLQRLPDDATHLAVSTGGNNALGQAEFILNSKAESYLEVLASLSHIQDDFQKEFRAMLERVLAKGLPMIVCTIYDSIPGLENGLRAGIGLFNDVIFREAFRAGVSVLDLRLLCQEISDYSPISPIEPSATGGGKIVRALGRALGGKSTGFQVFC